MNEVGYAFWNNENTFWIIDSIEEEKSYIGFLEVDLCCENADLIIGNHITSKISMESLGEYLSELDVIHLWNLETNGRTTITKRSE
ncbi:MAG: hypothetical protein ACW98W_18995 [Candidatus Hodarchaeales archaeon]|jgi:hypothetical protein